VAAALGFGAAMMRGAGGCALVVVEPAPAAGGHHARVLKVGWCRLTLSNTS